MVDNHDPLASFFCFFEVMRGEDHGHTRRLQGRKHLVDALATLRIDADRWFVEQHNLWRMQQADGDVQAPFHPTRKPLDRFLRAILEVGPFQRPLHPLTPRAGFDAIQRAKHLEVFARGEQGIDGQLLRHHANLRSRVALPHRPAKDRNGARVEGDPAGDGANHRGLAGAVGPEQSEQLAAAHRERGAGEGLGTAEPFPRAGDLKGVRVHVRHLIRCRTRCGGDDR